MSFGTTFFRFRLKHDFNKSVIDENGFHYVFDMDEFHRLIDLTVVGNGQSGGLIIGNLHIEGGIHLLQQFTYLDKLMIKYVGEMEGWEYLSGPILHESHGQLLSEINSIEKMGLSSAKTNFKPPDNCKILDLSDSAVPFVLLSPHRQFIINRKATALHINRILEIEGRYADK